jgi:hypothetical protein
VIVAGFFTTVLALRSDDGLVADDYYRQGIAINRQIERDRRARALSVSAVVEMSGTRVSVRLSGAGALSPALRLRLIHPTRAADDREANLVSSGGGLYSGELDRAAAPAGGSERRRLVLEDALGGWRILGTVSGLENAARLEPAP